MSMPNCFATASIRARGPTRIGAIRPSRAASTAPAQRALVAGMRDRRRRRRQRLAEVEQPLVLLVLRVPSCLASRRSRACARRGLAARGACAPSCAARMRRRRAARRDVAASRRCRSSIARCSADGFARCTRSSASSRSTSVTQPLAVGRRRRSSCGSVASASLRLVADDDLLLAAHAPPLVRRHVGQQVAVLARSAPASAASRESGSGSPLRASRHATRASASG